MRQYIALIHKDPGGDYGVSFPAAPQEVSKAGEAPRRARTKKANASRRGP